MYDDAKYENWDDVLPHVTLPYNTSRQDTTAFSPFLVLYAKNCATFLNSLLPYVPDYTCSDYASEAVTRAEESRQLAKTYALLPQQRQ